MATPGFHFNYSDFQKFEDFAKHAGREFSQLDGQSILSSDLVSTIKEYVKQEIRESLLNEAGESHRFGIFMAERTQIEVQAQGKRFKLIVSGMSEHDLASAGGEARITRDAEGKVNSKDINLWAMYENGQFDKSENGGDGGKKAIQKDTGGVLAIRTKRGDTTEFKGSYKGIIAGIMSRIRGELKYRLQDAIMHYTKAIVASGMAEAAEKANRGNKKQGSTRGAPKQRTRSGINRLPTQMRSEVKTESAKYEQALAALGVKVVFFKRGGKNAFAFQNVATGKWTSDVPTGMKERIISVLR